MTPLRCRRRQAGSWWPDWSNKLIWQIGILFGSVNSVYFCSNAFLPGHLTGAGRPDLISSALTALNFGQLPASFVLLAVAAPARTARLAVRPVRRADVAVRRRHRQHREPMDRLLCRRARLSRRRRHDGGLCAAGAIDAPSDVARMSAAMFTISYSEALVVSVLSGAAWDLGGSARFAFLPIAISALPLLFVPAVIDFHRKPDAYRNRLAEPCPTSSSRSPAGTTTAPAR